MKVFASCVVGKRTIAAAADVVIVVALSSCGAEESDGRAYAASTRGVSTPSLPIGVSSDDYVADQTCSVVSWLDEPEWPDGVTVAVTSVRIAGPGRAMAVGGCAGLPACPSFTYRSPDDRCSVRLKWTVPEEEAAQLALLGQANCAPGAEQSCVELMARLGGASRSAPVWPPVF